MSEGALDAATSTTTFVGWRAWRVRKGRLLSLTTNMEWRQGVAVEARLRLPPWRPVLATVALPLLCVWMYHWVFVSGPLWMKVAIGLTVPAALLLCLGCVVVLCVAVYYYCRGLLWVSCGHRVVPGNNTPGIFAYATMEQVSEAIGQQWFSGHYVRKPDSIMIRGTVELWGDTIEHDYGAKGQYAYPSRFDAVCCSRCLEWMPLSDYVDESLPPLHDGCVGRTAWAREHKQWKPAGLNALRLRVPEWFGKEIQHV